jgi:hypothetical protein
MGKGNAVRIQASFARTCAAAVVLPVTVLAETYDFVIAWASV